jgi:phospholipid transport system transporter-binding protein
MLVQGMRAQVGGDVVIDATALSRFDSSALAVLLELRRETMALGKVMSIRGLPTRLGDLAALYGIAELLPAASLAP